MRQGWKLLSLCAALALMLAGAESPAHAARSATASKSSAPKSTAKAKALRQFTGVVTSLDKSSITVEKGGKKPKTVVFTKHDEMRTQGELGKDARVTVYYRDEDGRAVAHRVVVKPEGGGK